MLGDKLIVQEWKYYKEAKSQREANNVKARIQRLGCNLPINKIVASRSNSRVNKIVNL